MIKTLKTKNFIEELDKNEKDLQFTEMCKVTDNKAENKVNYYYGLLTENEELLKKDKIHIFFLCFSLIDLNSFLNISNKYLYMINSINTKQTINLLIGMKSDLESSDITEQINYNLIYKAMEKLNSYNFKKVSSKNYNCLRDLLYEGLTGYFLNFLDQKTYKKYKKSNLNTIKILYDNKSIKNLSVYNNTSINNNINNNNTSITNKSINNNNNNSINNKKTDNNENNNKVLGNYEIVKVLGQGGEGIVYKVYLYYLIY
jgi:hypothetical protein